MFAKPVHMPGRPFGTTFSCSIGFARTTVGAILELALSCSAISLSLVACNPHPLGVLVAADADAYGSGLADGIGSDSYLSDCAGDSSDPQWPLCQLATVADAQAAYGGDADADAKTANADAAGPMADIPWISIPAGSVFVGCAPSDGSCEPAELPAHQIAFEPYLAMRHELTVAEFSDCVNAGYCTWPDTGDCLPISSAENVPMTCLSWVQARAFCMSPWVAGDLPTADQWERLARPNCSQAASATCMSLYVWGNAWPPPAGTSNLPDESLGAGQSDVPGYIDGYPGLAPVEAFAATPDGVFGLGGNVFEFVNSGGDAQCGPPDKARGCDARDVSFQKTSAPLNMRVSSVGKLDCCMPWQNVGVRCVRNSSGK